jgi:hypothetical protein
MRTPKALSYSALCLFERDPDEFYVSKLADHPAPRLPQEQPAAVGSAFDAYTKSMLAHALFGRETPAQFEFGTIFESQVEPQNRDFAFKAGKHVFKAYKFCGAYDDLLALLQKSIEPPRFEFTVNSIVNGVPFTGKPDVRFILDLGQGWRITLEGLRHLPGRIQVGQAQSKSGQGTRHVQSDGLPGRDDQLRLHGVL